MQSFLSKIALTSAVIALPIASTSANSVIIAPNGTLITYIAVVQLSTDDVEEAVNQQINEYRAKQGLPPLKLDPNISEQARIHSQNMANGTVKFSHDGFPRRVEAIATTISYITAAENIAYNQGYGDPATQAVQGWLNSRGHLKNIQGSYNQTGIGVVKNEAGEYYFTQIFIRTR